MFNQVSLAQLILRIRQRADMIDTQFVTDEEITSYCNESLGELYDLIIGSAAQEYFMRSCNIYEQPPWVRFPSDAAIPTFGYNKPGYYRDGFMIRDGKVDFSFAVGVPPVEAEVGQGTYAVLPPDFYKILGVDANVGQPATPGHAKRDTGGDTIGHTAAHRIEQVRSRDPDAAGAGHAQQRAHLGE